MYKLKLEKDEEIFSRNRYTIKITQNKKNRMKQLKRNLQTCN